MSEHNIIVEGGASVRLPTAGKYCDRDIVITAQGGSDGGNSNTSAEDAIISRNLSGAYRNDSVKHIGDYAFFGCYQLTSADFLSATGVGSKAFSGCEALVSVVLRNTEFSCVINYDALFDTPIAAGYGYIYVPAALMDDYLSNHNAWDCTGQFRALEEYTVDGTVTGELDPDKIGGNEEVELIEAVVYIYNPEDGTAEPGFATMVESYDVSWFEWINGAYNDLGFYFDEESGLIFTNDYCVISPNAGYQPIDANWPVLDTGEPVVLIAPKDYFGL